MKDNQLAGKTVVLTGGGTAGHITPNFALVPALKEAGARVCYIGLKDGMEAKLVAEEGLPFYGISGGKLRRNFSWKNVSDLGRIALGFFQSIGTLLRVRPQVVFSKGGFVTAPVVWAAWCLRIPVVLHESDLTPGLANRLSLPFAKRVAYAFKETGQYLPAKKSVYTGLPIRASVLAGDRAAGLLACGFDGHKPMLFITGGSQGARSVNGLIQRHLEALLERFDICHQVGRGNINPALVGQRGYCQLEYITGGMADLLAAADYVVSRAGATTIFELLALKKPHLLIPLGSRATRGDQILNAQSFEKSGYSLVLEDGPDVALIPALDQLVAHADQYRQAMTSADQKAVDSVLTLIAEVMRRG